MTFIPARLCRRLTAILFLAAVAMAHAATANAEWDIEKYDGCMKQTVRDPATCCLLSGGNIDPKDANNCQAPAALQEGVSPQPQWRNVPQDAVPTLILEPGGPADVMPGQVVGQP